MYNLMGGKVFEVDFLFARSYRPDDEHSIPADCLQLELPSRERNISATLFVPTHEREILSQCLDCLPWTHLSWSLHRGLRDILVAFGKTIMDRYRDALASELSSAVGKYSHVLKAKGYSPAFFERMADIASNSVRAGKGNSGDTVRVVTDVALLLWKGGDPKGLDETRFWRDGLVRLDEEDEGDFDVDAIIALTKFFVLEWSQEIDYMMYHDLPPQLLFS